MDIKWVYKYSLRHTKIKGTIEEMARKYIKMNAEEREILEMMLKDKANEFEKLACLSLVFVTIPIIINGIGEKLGCISKVVFGFILYLLIAILVIGAIRQCRKVKLYLEVIEDMNDGKIIAYRDGKKLE